MRGVHLVKSGSEDPKADGPEMKCGPEGLLGHPGRRGAVSSRGKLVFCLKGKIVVFVTSRKPALPPCGEGGNSFYRGECPPYYLGLHNGKRRTEAAKEAGPSRARGAPVRSGARELLPRPARGGENSYDRSKKGSGAFLKEGEVGQGAERPNKQENQGTLAGISGPKKPGGVGTRSRKKDIGANKKRRTSLWKSGVEAARSVIMRKKRCPRT